MSDSFADLWNSAAPSKPKPPPQKLGSPTVQPKPYLQTQKDLFAQLSSTSSSRSTTPSTVASSKILVASTHNDAFGELFGAAPSEGGKSPANMTIAERAALAEQQRLDSLLRQRRVEPSVPSAWDGLDTLGSKSFTMPRSEDTWGLEDFAAAVPVVPSQGEDNPDDILGDLSKPLDSVRPQKTTSPQRSRGTSPPPHILGQLIEMGFSISQARKALASTNQDVQAALEILISEGVSRGNGLAIEDHWGSDDEERGFTGSRSERQRTPSPPELQLRPRRDRQIEQQRQHERERHGSSPQPGLQADKLLAQASEIGFSLFNRANAAWREGKERVQKAYEEKIASASEEALGSRRGSGRSTPLGTKPKWMQDITDEQGTTVKQRPRSAEEQPAPLTDEVDLFSMPVSSSSPPTVPPTTGVYVSKFRHAIPKDSTPLRRLSSPVTVAPTLHPTTTVVASSSAISSSQQLKASGTHFFKLGDFPAAETAYTRAIEALPAGHVLLIPLYNNRALVRLKVGDVAGVAGDTGRVEELIGGAGILREELKRGQGSRISVKETGGEDEVNLGDALVKAWKRRAEAMEGREKWQEAGKDWERVAGAEWAGQSVRGEGARGAGRCRKMQRGPDPSRPKPRTAVPQTRRVSSPSSQALDALRAANEIAESEDLQKHALKDSVEARLQAWKGGKETNIRALLASLDTILWPELGVQKLSMAELINEGQVKVKYMKSIAKLHPDKLSTSNSTVEQRMIAGSVFGTLNEAWNAFKP
ncbi:hypothetical protein BDP27DRAFT_1330487 [Rhodocollybia butyracea]|uniref:UBA domain-containing protein n=1 Tax=Rhodocollybia butyracea TaxID=206335 RepID=A0A9P5PIN3_9AGAR|nr:hypothetical protein BDP27DRAFT_1330487 [Rhodocollybia butyracea]